ncbi:MAG: beta-ketoacyl-ACP synthase II [Deltaproteobacteria bacterium]|nr:beta-ketoacyl-ACP synthase II [Deltaproteobacteria bacterium]
MTRRVVVTGVGMTTPLGVTTEESWQGLIAGKSGIVTIEEWTTLEFAGHKLPVTIGGRVPGFDPEAWVEQKKDVRRMERFIQLAFAASHQAWQSAGLPAALDDAEGNRAGCIVGVGLGGLGGILSAYDNLREKGPRRVSAFFIPMIVANLAPGNLSIRYNLRGANWAPASACASGSHGIGEAFMHVREGRADLMLCGGAESTLDPLAVAGFASMHALCTTGNDDPARASRPFEKKRNGFVMGEGAGMLVIEELEHAKKRGANILAEVVGYGSSADASHITAPAEQGEGAQRAFREALAQAKLAPDAVGYINAHGTSTHFNDKSETDAIKAVFGAHAKKVMVSSTKSMIGHLLGGAGGVEAVISVLSMTRGVLPPTINYDEPDPECDLDYVPNTAREARVDVVQSNSFGFGGTNGVLLFSRFKG